MTRRLTGVYSMYFLRQAGGWDLAQNMLKPGEEVISVLFIGRFRPHSGNNSTGNRIKHHFEDVSCEYRYISRDVESFRSTEQFREFLITEHIHAVIGLHALHAGVWLKDCPVPYAVILGGTDINVHPKDSANMLIMTQTLERAQERRYEERIKEQTVRGARFIVGFSEPMIKRAKLVWPNLGKKHFREIPQAVRTHAVKQASINIRQHFKLSSDSLLITMAGGIRPVKDPLFLLPAFSEWHQLHNRNVFLTIIGPIVDQEYGKEFLDYMDGCPGVLYLAGLTSYDTHTLIRDSVAFVNSSQSEGMATAILEAMALGTPVLARLIAANSAIIENEQTGLLYYSPEDFIRKLEKLLDEPALGETLTANARARIKERHSCDDERKQYFALVKELYTLYDATIYPDMGGDGHELEQEGQGGRGGEGKGLDGDENGKVSEAIDRAEDKTKEGRIATRKDATDTQNKSTGTSNPGGRKDLVKHRNTVGALKKDSAESSVQGPQGRNTVGALKKDSAESSVQGPQGPASPKTSSPKVGKPLRKAVSRVACNAGTPASPSRESTKPSSSTTTTSTTLTNGTTTSKPASGVGVSTSKSGGNKSTMTKPTKHVLARSYTHPVINGAVPRTSSKGSLTAKLPTNAGSSNR